MYLVKIGFVLVKREVIKAQHLLLFNGLYDGVQILNAFDFRGLAMESVLSFKNSLSCGILYMISGLLIGREVEKYYLSSFILIKTI